MIGDLISVFLLADQFKKAIVLCATGSVLGKFHNAGRVSECSEQMMLIKAYA